MDGERGVGMIGEDGTIGNPFTAFFMLSHPAPAPIRIGAAVITEELAREGGTQLYVKVRLILIRVALPASHPCVYLSNPSNSPSSFAFYLPLDQR